MKKKSEKVILRKVFIKETLIEKNDIDILKSAWNNMPDDYTVEERMIFLEFAEKTIYAYRVWKNLISEEEKKEKN